MSDLIEDANKLVNDYIELQQQDIDAHKAINIIDGLLFEIAKNEKQLSAYHGVIKAAQYSIHCMEQAGVFSANALDQKMAKGLVDNLGKSISKSKNTNA